MSRIIFEVRKMQLKNIFYCLSLYSSHLSSLVSYSAVYSDSFYVLPPVFRFAIPSFSTPSKTLPATSHCTVLSGISIYTLIYAVAPGPNGL